jgi:hypothetical protein
MRARLGFAHTEHPTVLYLKHGSCRGRFVAYEASIAVLFNHVVRPKVFHRRTVSEAPTISF